jgi:hypothetical protein
LESSVMQSHDNFQIGPLSPGCVTPRLPVARQFQRDQAPRADRERLRRPSALLLRPRFHGFGVRGKGKDGREWSS